MLYHAILSAKYLVAAVSFEAGGVREERLDQLARRSHRLLGALNLDAVPAAVHALEVLHSMARHDVSRRDTDAVQYTLRDKHNVVLRALGRLLLPAARCGDCTLIAAQPPPYLRVL